MANKRKYKIIAAFLLTVFSLNTIVGFACSVGLDMGFNSKHHDQEATEAVVHIHADGKKHIHYEKKKSHSHGKSHDHDQPKNHQKPNKDDSSCCKDQVAKFGQLDKSLPQYLNILHPIFLIAFFDVFYEVVLPSTTVVKNIKQFLRGYHPPISNIRIAIQSFQI
jgi:hypothetical protein